MGDLPAAPATELLAGGVVGVYQLVPLSQRRSRQRVQFYFQPELLLSLQGHRLENPATQYQARIRSYYATLPLLLTASWQGVLVQAGVQGGYLLGVSERYEFGVPTPGVGYSHDTSIYQRKELAYVVGVGYGLPQGLGLEVRYVAGLTDLYDKNGQGIYSTYTDQHNAGVQLQLSYPLLQKK
ncbi:MAG: PorT family protein [Hymenobacter sp.]|nr:MAG: PorT family protein [Hymenobacter sp.]